MSTKLTTTILTLLIGFGLGFMYNASDVKRLNSAIDVFYPPVPNEIFSVFGTITEVNGDKISIEIASPSQRLLPGDEPKKETRTVSITKDTKITELDTFSIASTPTIDPGTGLPTFPQPKTISQSDLKVGDNIVVTAVENIKSAQSFTATEIQRQVGQINVSQSVPIPPQPVPATL